MALMVMAVVLTAVVTLAYALSAAHDSTSDISEKQAQVRYATLRISELIKYSRLVCAQLSGDLVMWCGDDNGDDQINISEIMYIETGYNRNYIRLLQFYPNNPSDDRNVSLGLVRWWYLKNILTSKYPEFRTTLMEDCEDIRITLDDNPPYTKLVNIQYKLEEDDQLRTYQISTALRCWAGNLIKTSYSLVTEDDD